MRAVGLLLVAMPLALVAWFYRRQDPAGGLVSDAGAAMLPTMPSWSTPAGTIASEPPAPDLLPAFELQQLPDWLTYAGIEVTSAPADTLTTYGGSISLTQNWTTPSAGLQYADAFATAEKFYGLPTNLLSAVAYQESRYNKNARSNMGAIGLMQFLPSTARDYGIDPTDPMQSIDGAARYLRDLYKKFGSWESALAAYNWGQGNLSRKGIDAAPTETKNYFSQILARVFQ